jgi:peptide deformylase
MFGDPVLREHAEEVTTFDRELRLLVADLTDTLRDQEGSGLAATQIGVPLRAFTFHVDGVEGHLINPVLDFPDDEEQDGPEGCLSMPGLYFDTVRRLNAVARGVDEHGRPLQIVGTGMMARCLQHETDHLDGILFIDRMDAERRKNAMRAIRKADFGGAARPVKISPHRIRGPFT